ncbi:MAG: hypothetical protein ABJL64_20110 [Rhizobiaceae bacterium]
MKRLIITAFSLFLAGTAPSVVLAWGGEGASFGGSGGSSGGNGCGGCLPAVLRESAKPLSESFRNTAIPELIAQKYEKSLCNHHPCGNFAEETAAEFLGDLVSEFRREEDLKVAKWGLATGIGGFIIAVLAFVQSLLSNMKTRRATERIVRNETKLEYLEKSAK